MGKIRTAAIYLLFFSLLAVVGGVLAKFTRTGRNFYAQSDSPDGNYTCTVIERRARWPKVSLNLYLFSIHKQGSDEPLHGGSKLVNKDSVVIGRLEFGWQAGRLAVSEDGHLLLTATISNNLPSWIDHAMYVPSSFNKQAHWNHVLHRLEKVDREQTRRVAIRLFRTADVSRLHRFETARYLLVQQDADFNREYREFLISAILDGGEEEFCKPRVDELSAVGEYTGKENPKHEIRNRYALLEIVFQEFTG